jgi:glutamate-1-semialdehyde 2,1-aminomutase
MNETLPFYIAGLGALAAVLPRIKRRLELSRAKHPSLAGHSRMAKRVARLIPFYEYDEARFYSADQAPPEIACAARPASWPWLRSIRNALPVRRR